MCDRSVMRIRIRMKIKYEKQVPKPESSVMKAELSVNKTISVHYM